jgi:NAD(P)-dependent dehydrogenase (short-subunit alcohol dehydrogenase family)
MNDKKTFADKIAIVTGAASGIGRELALQLGEAGAIVSAADRNFDGSKETASLIGAKGGRATAVKTDVRDVSSVKKLIDNTVSENGRLDYIFNNAGIGVAAEVQDMSPDHWQDIVDTNLWGVVYGTTLAYSVMVKQGFGHIINTASLAGLVPSPIVTAYSMTKHAVVGLSTSLREEAKDLGVRISVLCPGVIDTNILQEGRIIGVDREKILVRIPWMMDVKKAVRHILRGVRRNKRIIVITLPAKILWRLYRVHSFFAIPFFHKLIGDFRKYRIEG